MAPNIGSIVDELHGSADPKNVSGMARFGIVCKRALGISVCPLRALARRVRHNHGVAEGLWSSGIFEARILAAFVAERTRVTRRQANAWANNLECWADCDGLCVHLFRKTPFAHELALAWTRRREELIKCAGLSMMATLAVHDKMVGDEVFCGYLSRVRDESNDERHNVKKGVNWALRQIGKRNRRLSREAMRVAKQIQREDSRAAKWIASDALHELNRWQPKGLRPLQSARLNDILDTPERTTN